MTAIALCDPPNLEAYDILAQNAKADLTLRTPIFSIQVLHFATTRLDIPLLQNLINNPNTPLEAAGTTALGHTLLHISTLPHINIFNRKSSTASPSVAARRSLPLARTAEDEEGSRSKVLWLLRTGTQDVYGNTPLHYLASAM